MDETTFSLGIAVMAKASAPGRTKTRLVPPLSAQEAAELNTAFLKDVAENLIAAAREAPVSGYMAYGPPGSRPFFDAILPPGIGLIESWIGPLGECLSHAIGALFGHGHTGACVLNADSPTLPTALLVEAATELARPGDRAVLGPSDDGGYYLLALKAEHPRLFEEIDWSTDRVAGQTLERAREIGLPVHVLAPWYDVDDAATLERVRRDLDASEAGPDGGRPFGARHTRALLAAMASGDAIVTTDLAAAAAGSGGA